MQEKASPVGGRVLLSLSPGGEVGAGCRLWREGSYLLQSMKLFLQIKGLKCHNSILKVELLSSPFPQFKVFVGEPIIKHSWVHL